MTHRTCRPLILALLVASPLAAQQVSRVGGRADILAFIRAPENLAGTPAWWRDSVQKVWVSRVPAIPAELPHGVIPGSHATLVLRLLRNGDLHQARLEGSVGSSTVDSLLLAAVASADQALEFPALPPQVEGRGLEVRIEVAIPLNRAAPLAPRTGELDVPPLSPACEESLRRPTGFETVNVGARVDSASGFGAGKAWGDRVVTTIAAEWRPVPQALPVARPTLLAQHELTLSARRTVSGWIRLSISGTGRLQSASLMASTSYPAIDSAILTAIQRADSSGAIPPPPSTRNDTAVVDLSIEEMGTPSAPLMHIGSAGVATWVTESQPSLIHAGPVQYPEALRSRQIGGRLIFEFVVGADGVPIPSSIQVRSATDPAFAAASLPLVRGSRYHPAMLRGCAIPMLVRQGVNFQP